VKILISFSVNSSFYNNIMIYSRIRKILMPFRVPLDIGSASPAVISFYYLVEQIVIRVYNVPRGISKIELSSLAGQL